MGLCSIIILTYNAVKYTRLCIDSISKYTNVPYELILVDNGSTDGTMGFLNSFASSRTTRNANGSQMNSQGCNTFGNRFPSVCKPPIRHTKRPLRIMVIRNNQNLGYAKGCNQGASVAHGNSLLFLNNDTLVAQNWLENLLYCLNSKPDIGAVNPCSNFNPYAQINTPGDRFAEIEKFANNYNRRDPAKWRESSGLSGFCLLVKKSVFDHMGGFDEQFQIGCYEDTDLTFRMHQGGYKIMIAWDTFVYHFGNRSFAANGLDVNHYMDQNKRKYLLKHPQS